MAKKMMGDFTTIFPDRFLDKKEKEDPLGKISTDQEKNITEPIWEEFGRLVNNYIISAFNPLEMESSPKIDSFEKMVIAANGIKSYALHAEIALPAESQKTIKVLELACGRAPFLARLYIKHQKPPCIENVTPCPFNRVIDYLGTDLEESLDWEGNRLMIAHLGHQQNLFRDCFPSVIFDPCDLRCSSDLDRLVPSDDQPLWDMILLSNAFHELPLDGWVNLLSRIPEMLSDGGIFALIDLDLDHRFQLEYWVSSEKLLENRFFETEGFWLSLNDVSMLLEAADLTVTDHGPGGGNQEWWIYTAKRKGDLSEQATRDRNIKAAICDIIDRQNGAFFDGFSKKLQEIVETVTNSDSIAIRTFAALNFLSYCTSHAYRTTQQHVLR